MRTARPESLSWPGDCLLLAWARQTQGHWVRELASSPLAQAAPLRGVGADTGPMVSTRQTGAYQTACDHNQQWQGTMDAIIYKNTVQVSFSLPYYACLLSLSFAGRHRGGVTPSVQSSAGPFHSAQGYPAIHAASPSGPISVQLQPLPEQHSKFDERSRETHQTEHQAAETGGKKTRKSRREMVFFR